MAPPDFGRSVNPISTRGDRLCPRIIIGTPGFSDLPTALNTQVINLKPYFPHNICTTFITSMNRIQSSHQSTSAWAADRINIVIVEDYTIIGQSIDIWGHNLIGAMKANIIPALLPNRHIRVRWVWEILSIITKLV